MKIVRIIEQAFLRGSLSLEMQAEVERVLAASPDLSVEDYLALCRLRDAVAGRSLSAPGLKPFRNVMEEMVWEEVLGRLAADRECLRPELSLGDVVAHALNRLPPLYATSERGAGFQRERARDEMGALIALRVQEGFSRALENPRAGRPDAGSTGDASQDLLSRIDALLRVYAERYEPRGGEGLPA